MAISINELLFKEKQNQFIFSIPSFVDWCRISYYCIVIYRPIVFDSRWVAYSRKHMEHPFDYAFLLKLLEELEEIWVPGSLSRDEVSH